MVENDILAGGSSLCAPSTRAHGLGGTVENQLQEYEMNAAGRGHPADAAADIEKGAKRRPSPR